MIRGPTEYVPSVEVEVVMRRSAIPLDENEGIYVRDVKTGRVRAVIGQTYMLTQVRHCVNILCHPCLPSVRE
jgi:major vault protein